MRQIILITTSFPEVQDGSEAAGSFVVDFAEALAEKSTVVVVAPGLTKGRYQINTNLTVLRFHAPRQPLSLLKAYNPLHWPAIITTLRNGQTTVLQAAQDKNTSHILALWALPSGYWAKKAAQLYDIPYSTWALGSDIWNLGRLPIVKNILQKVLRASAVNFADGLQLKKDVEKLSRRNCVFLPSTRTLNLPRKKVLASKPPYKLAFLGRWHKNKGIDLLLESLALLNDIDWQRIEEVRICGGGPLAPQVYSKASVLMKQGRPIIIKGYQNKEEATDLFLWADYLLIPSRIESIPVVFSDALQTMTPAIVMPVGDFPILYENNAPGEMAKSVTAKDFYQAICSTLCSTPINYKVQLQEHAKTFNIKESANRFWDCVNNKYSGADSAPKTDI